MGSIAEGERNKMLDALCGRAAYSASAAVYAQLHTGDPGAAGTSNVATETTRQAVTFGSAAASGAISNTAQVQWTSLAATETISHISLWTASSAGTFLGSDDLASAQNVNAGGTLTIAVGDLDLTVT